jgi:hypothetical protein
VYVSPGTTEEHVTVVVVELPKEQPGVVGEIDQ